MAARDTLAAFVAGGNMRDADAPSMTPERAKELQERVTALRAGTAPLAASDAPGDFRAAIQKREQEAATKAAASRGADIPRKWESNPIINHVYRAHDAIASLPAPGGLAAVIVAIIVLFFLVVPATSAGETRALLLWEVLLGKKQVPTDTTSANAPGSGLEAVAQAGQQLAGGNGGSANKTQATGTGSMYPLMTPLDSYPTSAAPEGL